jgi:hypothetical protein
MEKFGNFVAAVVAVVAPAASVVALFGRLKAAHFASAMAEDMNQ